jgi:hypothetical protein
VYDSQTQFPFLDTVHSVNLHELGSLIKPMVASRDIYVLVCVNGSAFVLCGHDECCLETARHDSSWTNDQLVAETSA